MFGSMTRPPTVSVLGALVFVVVTLAWLTQGCGPRGTAGEFGAIGCANGYDDDFDGLPDCADPGCMAFCGGGSDSGTGGGVCGDALCSLDESCASCPADCGACCTGESCPAACGDGLCNGTEACESCPADCGACAFCGDGVLDKFEQCDGFDLGGESCATLGLGSGTLYCAPGCIFDTGSCTGAGGCGDGWCDAPESCSTCTADCGPCCGNGSCSGGETCSTCPTDCGSCGPVCGDFSCSGGETCSSCPTDCGSCGPVCGDFSCSGGETCSSCPTDCGSCGGGLELYDWDDATLQGWSVSNTCSSTGWRVDSYRSYGAPYSLWYGNPTTRTYDCAGATNSGYAYSPTCTLGSGAPSIDFYLWMATEQSSTYDNVRLYISTSTGDYEIWNAYTATGGTTSSVWELHTASLSAYAGQTVSFYFLFDTVDSAANAYEGVYVDELTIDATCF